MSDVNEKVLKCPTCGGSLEKHERIPKSANDESIYCSRTWCGVQICSDDNSELYVRTFRLSNHYSLFLLPFAFRDAEDESAFQRLKSSSRWKRKRFSMDDPEDVDRTEYFLPYARRFLYPSLYQSKQQEEKHELQPTCQHYEFDLSLIGNVDEKGIPFSLYGDDDRKKISYRHEMTLESVSLMLFNYRVGFLILRVQNTDPRVNFFQQMDAAFYCRLIAPLYRGFDMPNLKMKEHDIEMPHLCSFLLGEFSSSGPVSLSSKQQITKSDLPVKALYDDRMMVYTFSCINKKMVLPDLDRCQRLLEKHVLVNFDDEATLPVGKSEAEDAAKAWLNQRWRGFSKDGGSMAVFNSYRYHEEFLGVYFASYYLDIFLLAALQRVTLLLLFERLSDIEALTTGSFGNSRMLKRVRKDLLLFKNQSWFSQLTNRERGLVLWKKWQRVFENRVLMEEVNEQSKELEAYLQSKTREKVEWGLRLGGFMATAIPAILGMEVVFGKQPWLPTARWIMLLSLVFGTGIFAWFILFKKED